MKRKEKPLFIIALLLTGTLTLALEIQQARAQGLDFIYITALGPVEPQTANITWDGNVYYTLNASINGSSIVILRDNITLDGNNNVVSGLSDQRIGTGIDLTDRKNVMIKNLNVRWFQVGILLNGSNNCQLYRNRIFDGNNNEWDSVGIKLLNSSYNTLFHNTVYQAPGATQAFHHGIVLYDSSHNRIFNSTSSNNGHAQSGFGIYLENSSCNDVFDNKVSGNHDGIIISNLSNNNSIFYNNIIENTLGDILYGAGIEVTFYSSYNRLTHNNVINNYRHVIMDAQAYNNSWDDGYPSGGNHWGNHTQPDSFHGPYQNETVGDVGDGIVDKPYNITTTIGTVVGKDRYPFVKPIGFRYVYLTIEAVLGGTTDPVPETYPFVNGSQVTVTATPSVGRIFWGWTLDGVLRTENPITITMNSNHTLKASFNYPNKPTLNGPPLGSGYVYTNITFTAYTTDLDGDNVTYEFGWGDGTTCTIGPYASGATAWMYHSWSRPDNYTVSVRAKDIFDAWSNSSSLNVSITQNDAGMGVDAGNSFNSSLLIAQGSYKGTLYSSNHTDRYDYYGISIPIDWTVDVTMTPPPNVNFDLELYSPINPTTPKNWSYLGPGQTDRVSYKTDSDGWWRILIKWVSGEGQYSFSVSLGFTGRCPYVSAWNGTQYVLDNNILPSSELSNGTDVQDYYRLEQALVQGDGKYSLLISEFEQEHTYIDQIKLIAVDHKSDVNIAVTPDGEILTYKKPAAPISAIDNYGNNRLNQIRHIDGNVSDPATYFDGFPSDYLILNFGQVNIDNAKLILRTDWKKDEECILVQVKDGSGSWQAVKVLIPRAYWSIEAVNLTPYVVRGQDLLVRLYWKYHHRLDYVGLDTTKQAEYEIHYANLVSATHSAQGNVKPQLQESDNVYAELVPVQQIQLEFTLPNNSMEARTYILYTKGHYNTIAP